MWCERMGRTGGPSAFSPPECVKSIMMLRFNYKGFGFCARLTTTPVEMDENMIPNGDSRFRTPAK